MWTYSAYRELIAILQEKNFAFSFFGEKSGKDVYLRHDIDVSIDYALPLAELERALGVKSTYFVLAVSDAYNPFSEKNLEQLQQILSLGHEIGLHVWNSEKIASESAFLAEALKRPIRFFSLHRPASSSVDFSALAASGLINAYDPAYFSKESYISDSNGNFRVGDPYLFLKNFTGERLQFLTHPLWWGEAPLEISERVRSLEAHHASSFRSYLSGNIAAFKEAIECSPVGVE